MTRSTNQLAAASAAKTDSPLRSARQSDIVTRMGAALGDFLSALDDATDGELDEADRVLLDVSSGHSRNQLPLGRSRKKVDKREHARLEVLRRAFCEAAFIVRAEKATARDLTLNPTRRCE